MVVKFLAVALIVAVALNVALVRGGLSRATGADWPTSVVNAGTAFGATVALLASVLVIVQQL